MSFRVAGCSLLKTRGDGVGFQKWVEMYESIGHRLSDSVVRVLAGEFRDHTRAFLQEMRKQACINIAAWLPYKQEGNEFCVSSSYMFILGQVRSLHLAFTERTLWEREPNSRGNGSEALPTRRADMGDRWTSTPLEDLSWPALPAGLKDIFRGEGPGFFVEHHSGGHRKDASKGWSVIPNVNQKSVRCKHEHTEKLSNYMGSRISRRSEDGQARRNWRRPERAIYHKAQPWAQWYSPKPW